MTKNSVDNPGDSKIPLDLGFPVRESTPRTGKRTPTGARKTECRGAVFGPGIGAHGPGPRGESGSGRGVKPPRASKRRADGKPEVRGGEASGSRTEGYPNYPVGDGSGGVKRGHGKPGQRERRRGANGAGQPADRGTDSGSGGRASGGSGRRALRQRRQAFGSADGVGAGPSSGNRCGAERQRGRATGRPGLDSGDGGRFAGRSTRGGRRAAGFARECRRVSARGRCVEGSRAGFARSTGRKKGIARRVPRDNDGRCG